MKQELERMAAVASIAADHARLAADDNAEGAAMAAMYLCEGIAKDLERLGNRLELAAPGNVDLQDILGWLQQAMADSEAGTDGPEAALYSVDQVIQHIQRKLHPAP